MILEGAVRVESLALAMIKIARKAGSALFNQLDLHDLVKRDCPDEHRPYWDGPYCSAPQVTGLLHVEGWERIELGWWGGPVDGRARKVGELRRLVEAQKVDFWDREEDRAWRLVNRGRDIGVWINNPWAGGHRCRVCLITENPLLDELKRLPDEHKVPAWLSGCLLHDRCVPQLLEWCKTTAVKTALLEAPTHG
jgi:hypothetical protein